MKIRHYPLLLGAVLLAFGSGAQALQISISPSSPLVNQGGNLSVAIVIAGLAPGGAPSLGSFDLNLSFDPAILGLDPADGNGDGVIDSVLLDPDGQLDTFAAGLNLVAAGITAIGTVNLFELSFDLPMVLNANQASSFTLATISFLAVAPGTSALGLGVLALSDELGRTLTATLSNASVSVSDTQVPIPSPLLLLLAGVGWPVARAFRECRARRWSNSRPDV
ncbi:cohesin domain-containing protein [Candidatus Thiodictyon syntrophicum]|jgi:hypothetical protein|uniref:Cohesin domain-containing protein n=1 Tax=Candidatus Thiodictyon syntrophicum TaxID=1166950 RepID=A0A2K8UFK4_9GAMM|nr:cohesin domain-containing protein [Candidatus Thiodictyon syntrophicum]AUB84336.1 hypothetical protein THSYN_27635 [Candidatus Thiodictyon syntrophicum]